jgi:hypothetical protein
MATFGAMVGDFAVFVEANWAKRMSDDCMIVRCQDVKMLMKHKFTSITAGQL